MTPANATGRQGDPRGSEPQVIKAAGALCWDHAPARGGRHGGLQVLLVHRPRYDDWSWPKGKLEPGEGFVEAAVREVAEETGLQVRLGRDLPTARYRLDETSTKEVAYWAAHVPGSPTPRPPRPKEVDATEWVSTAEAERRLTRRGDRVQLAALVTAHTEASLDTWPLLVLRHGHARPKSVWGHADAERPLVKVGLRQADALVPLLQAWAPERVVSSPWERCLQTIGPYVEAAKPVLKTKNRLSEDGHRREPAKVAALVSKLIAKRRPVVLCTHRPVLSTVLGTLAGHTGAGLSTTVPSSDPYLLPGEVLVAHVSFRSGRVVRVERHLPGGGVDPASVGIDAG